MKKTYIQPNLAVERMDTMRMIAASGDAVAIDPVQTGVPEDADSRLFEDILGGAESINPIPFGL